MAAMLCSYFDCAYTCMCYNSSHVSNQTNYYDIIHMYVWSHFKQAIHSQLADRGTTFFHFQQLLRKYYHCHLVYLHGNKYEK